MSPRLVDFLKNMANHKVDDIHAGAVASSPPASIGPGLRDEAFLEGFYDIRPDGHDYAAIASNGRSHGGCREWRRSHGGSGYECEEEKIPDVRRLRFFKGLHNVGDDTYRSESCARFETDKIKRACEAFRRPVNRRYSKDRAQLPGIEGDGLQVQPDVRRLIDFRDR